MYSLIYVCMTCTVHCIFYIYMHIICICAALHTVQSIMHAYHIDMLLQQCPFHDSMFMEKRKVPLAKGAELSCTGRWGDEEEELAVLLWELWSAERSAGRAGVKVPFTLSLSSSSSLLPFPLPPSPTSPRRLSLCCCSSTWDGLWIPMKIHCSARWGH